MSRFVCLQGARPQETISVFKGWQRSREEKWPYPSDGETAATCHVAPLNRAKARFSSRSLHLFAVSAAKASLFYENVT